MTDPITWSIVENSKLPETKSELARVLEYCSKIRGWQPQSIEKGVGRLIKNVRGACKERRRRGS